MRERIAEALSTIELDDHVRVLLAVESGSRAWGFPSQDSDWDVRFIYAQHPDWYLSVQARRDVLEYPISDALDVSGWDLRKALQLMAKSNPPLLEWLRSPIVYLEATSAADQMRALSSSCFNPRSCMYHYLHMAEGNFREYLRRGTVPLKKYFYVLRPVLACKWIQQDGTMPPMEFQSLVESQLPEHVRPAVLSLLERKRAGDELEEGPRVPEINEFLEDSLATLRDELAALSRSEKPDWDSLDQLFRDVLGEAWRAAG
jgi:hypothetical protein